MKNVIYVVIGFLIFIVCIGCAITSKTKESKEDIKLGVFFHSVMSGDFAEVKRLIDAGADVNAQTNEGTTALMYASAAGRTEIAELLIEEGTDVNAQTKGGVTALMFASMMGETEAAQLLIETGADINA